MDLKDIANKKRDMISNLISMKFNKCNKRYKIRSFRFVHCKNYIHGIKKSFKKVPTIFAQGNYWDTVFRITKSYSRSYEK